MLKINLFILCLILGACTMVGPNYKEPEKQVTPHWLEKNASVSEAPFQNALWWRTFHDSALTELIYTGYENNLSIQIAGAKILQARAQLAQSVGELFPQQQAAIGNLTYYRTGGGSLQEVLPQQFETASLGFTAAWEIDFWGKYRRAIQANNASFLSSIAAYDNALITLTADVATTYVQIRTIESKIKVTKANIRVQTIGLTIAKSRFKAGESSLVDVEQAQTELSQTQAALPPLVSQLQKQKDLLAYLLGTTPDSANVLLKENHGIPKAPKAITLGIPVETLARRPDVFQARQDAIAQSALVGATLASLYPSFSLTGTFTFNSNTINTNSLTDIFQWSNRAVSAGPGFTWPLLNYGQITNAVRVQDAIYEQALLHYRDVVLKAQQEVQDNITAFIEAKNAERYLVQANNAATKSLKLTLERYQEGETDFTPVLNAEQQLLKVQLSLTNAQGDIPLALIALYRSLGGGWQIRGCNDVVPFQVKAEMGARTNWGSLLKQQNHQPPMTKSQKFKQLFLPKW